MFDFDVVIYEMKDYMTSGDRPDSSLCLHPKPIMWFQRVATGLQNWIFYFLPFLFLFGLPNYMYVLDLIEFNILILDIAFNRALQMFLIFYIPSRTRNCLFFFF